MKTDSALCESVPKRNAHFFPLCQCWLDTQAHWATKFDLHGGLSARLAWLSIVALQGNCLTPANPLIHSTYTLHNTHTRTCKPWIDYGVTKSTSWWGGWSHVCHGILAFRLGLPPAQTPIPNWSPNMTCDSNGGWGNIPEKMEWRDRHVTIPIKIIPIIQRRPGQPIIELVPIINIPHLDNGIQGKIGIIPCWTSSSTTTHHNLRWEPVLPARQTTWNTSLMTLGPPG